MESETTDRQVKTVINDIQYDALANVDNAARRKRKFPQYRYVIAMLPPAEWDPSDVLKWYNEQFCWHDKESALADLLKEYTGSDLVDPKMTPYLLKTIKESEHRSERKKQFQMAVHKLIAAQKDCES